jgi:hypothetical protein
MLMRLWILLVAVYLIFAGVVAAYFWSPIRYELKFAASGWPFPLALASYLLGLGIFGRICVARKWNWKTCFLGFVLLGGFFGITAQGLERLLYHSQAEWGLHAFYPVSAIAAAVVGFAITLIVKHGK